MCRLINRWTGRLALQIRPSDRQQARYMVHTIIARSTPSFHRGNLFLAGLGYVASVRGARIKPYCLACLIGAVVQLLRPPRDLFRITTGQVLTSPHARLSCCLTCLST